MKPPRGARADAARRAALERRLARLKVATLALTAGAWLALWALVSGALPGTTQAAAPAGSAQESQTIDLFGGGSTLGTTPDAPVLRSRGS